MLTRSVHIQPKFQNIGLIESIRKKYDPLFYLIPPHITIVFPFKSSISSKKLKQHIEKQTSKQETFMMSLETAVSFDVKSCNIYIEIIQGNQNIINLHNLLYSDFLKIFKKENYYYAPHLTVGNISSNVENKDKIISVLECSVLKKFEFKTYAQEIICEIIDKNEKSNVEFIVKLN